MKENNKITGAQEDLIFKTREFIQELAKVQDLYYDNLKKELNLAKEIEDFLFDYIYNWDEPTCFEEHLEKYNNYKPILNETN